jgi:UDP-glucose 4-epimerase
MKCLVLGGTGFLGTHICRALVRLGHSVRVFATRDEHVGKQHVLSGEVEYVRGVFFEVLDWQPLLDGCEAVFHCISTTVPETGDHNPLFDLESNVVPTVRLLDSVSRSGGKLIFLSSAGTVYGPQRTPQISEAHPTEPLCAYGVGKLAIEKYLAFYGHTYGLRYCIARISNPFGEGQGIRGAQGAIGIFIRNALLGRALEVWGDGEVVRDYLYASDVTSALMRMISYDGPDPCFNIGSGVGRSLNSVISAISKVSGLELQVKYLPARQCDTRANIIDSSRARCLLQWHPEVPFEVGLSLTAEWMKRELPISLGVSEVQPAASTSLVPGA